MFSDLMRFCLDGYADGAIRGWVWDPMVPSATRQTEVLIDGVVIASGSATVFREDLRKKRIGDGRCAFVLSPRLTPALLRGGLSVVVDGQTMLLPRDKRASVEAGLRDAFLARLRGLITIAGRQLSNRSVEISWQVSPEDPAAIGGLEIELDAGAGGMLRQPLAAGAGGVMDVPIPANRAVTAGVVKAEAWLVSEAARLQFATVEVAWSRRPAELRGNCDRVTDGVLNGWSVDRSDPGEPLRLRIFVDDIPIGETVADRPRADLAKANPERPDCAFEIAVPPEFLTGERRYVAIWSIAHGEFVPGVSPVHEFGRIVAPDRFVLPRSRFELQVAAPRVPNAAKALFPSGKLTVETEVWARIAQALAPAHAPTVVVPVHEAFDDVVDCLNALFENTDPAVPVVVVDDGSADPRLTRFLDAAATLENVRLLRNPGNIGYTRSVNAGIRAAAGDVVLLNSDTRVGPRWLENLLAARAQATRVGTVTAVSNNAGAFSVPVAGKDTRLPLSVSDASIVRAFAYAGQPPLPVPTGNGFCMLVSREMLDEIGLFDEEAYPRGYGEENDLAMRALAAGWTHLVCDTVFVFHRRSASFNQLGGRDELFARSQRRLVADHPYYVSYAKALSSPGVHEQMRAGKGALVTALAAEPNRRAVVRAARPRVLIILHYLGEGGTALTTLDLCRHLSRHFEVLLFHRTGSDFELGYFNADSGAVDKLMTVRLPRPPRFIELGDHEYASLVSTILTRWQVALVHIRHLHDHSRIVARVVRSHRLPYYVSLHDFYAVCPTINLVNGEGRYCGGACGSGDAECLAHESWPADLGRLRGQGVHVWRRAWSEVLGSAEGVITTSPYAAGLFAEALGTAAASRMHVIEHGRDFPQQHELSDPPSGEAPIKVLMLGNLLSRAKGFATVRAVHDLDSGGRIAFHFLGAAPADAARIGVVHGRYERDSLPALVAQIRPSFVGIFSIWPETYCHTLSEAWWLGIPVIASGLGATGERIRAHGGGVVADTADPAATLAAILDAARPERYETLRASALVSNMRTLAEMGEDYVALYRRALGLGPPARGATQAAGPLAAAAAEWLSARPERTRMHADGN